MSAQKLTLLTRCPRSKQLYGHCVHLINDYANTNFSKISLQKRQISLNRFCLFKWGPDRAF